MSRVFVSMSHSLPWEEEGRRSLLHTSKVKFVLEDPEGVSN